MSKFVSAILSIPVMMALLINAVYAAGTEKTITLEENWHLTSSLDINAGEGNIIIIDGQNKYTVYEMVYSANLINSTGTVRLKNVKIINAGTNPAAGSLAALSKAASGITSVTAPARDAATLAMPTAAGFTVSIKSSSNEGIIAKDGTVSPPAAQQTVDLVFTLTGNGGEADTASISVTVPARTGSGGGGEYTPTSGPSAVVNNGIIIPDTTITNGTANAVVDNSYVSTAFEQAKANDNGTKTIMVEVKETSSVRSYSAQLPAVVFKDGTEDKRIRINCSCVKGIRIIEICLNGSLQNGKIYCDTKIHNEILVVF